MPKPIIVLVHGTFCDSSCWDRVSLALQEKGYQVIALANPLRGMGYDDKHLASLLEALGKEKDSEGNVSDIVLVGHSYGGAVITNGVLAGNTNVKAMVYVSATAPMPGELLIPPEHEIGLRARALPATAQEADDAGIDPKNDLLRRGTCGQDGKGVCDLYIRQDKFGEVLIGPAAGESETMAMAANQRPLSAPVIDQKSEIQGWKDKKPWFIIPKNDQVLPAATQRKSAERATEKGRIHEVEATHMIILSHSETVARIIIEAASSIAK
ncbi:alpha/beta fold hydrolase [Streptomyces johnsoniae]|uniref:Alpha/beta hydrolase n=1 Tax=Streptomyces johnsoniae TaxID=3075532 RepID=A0ABU2SES4_9ACTN|nr:alpha/beta hydrolase [Streptomyces sp. DSM 41886]MDT0446369.1 alpha/beta hydrolase [Streptomyces sp. DSM 41886]